MPYLESPYDEQERFADAFEAWCIREDLEVDDIHLAEFEAAMGEAEEAYLEGVAEDRAAARDDYDW